MNERNDEKPFLKRQHNGDSSPTNPKKFSSSKSDDSAEEDGSKSKENNEMQQPLSSINPSDYARELQCIAQALSNASYVQPSQTDANRFNRERGMEIVNMASQYDALVDSASRSPAANLQRNQIWTKITQDINSKFPLMTPLTFEQCKKLCKYYKRKCSKSTTSSRTDDIVREDPKPSADLLNFLATCNESTPSEGLMANELAASSQQRKERANFVCDTAEKCEVFESTSRSYQANAERSEIWKKIAAVANEKYGGELGDLSVEQAKKLYANARRKCQLNCVKSSKTEDSVSNVGDCGNSRGSPNELASDCSSTSELLNRITASSSNCRASNIVESLMSLRNTDSKAGSLLNNDCNKAYDVPYDRLLCMLSEAENQIVVLKQKLVQQDVEHKLQMVRVVEVMNTLMKEMVGESVRKTLLKSINASMSGANDSLSDANDDDNT